ncbi:MAG TPA: S8 family peptidase [Salinivirgaceae bacterium]|nr:S8 family peptidase [Salinivirgaceae bacterium]
MKNYKYLLIVTLLIPLTGIAQSVISPRLESVMNENKGKIVQAIFRLSEQWNADSALAIYSQQKITASQQAKQVVISCERFTKQKQQSFLQAIEDVKSSGAKIQKVYPFKTANLIAVWANEITIRTLANHQDVSYVYYDHSDYKLLPSYKGETVDSKSLATSGIIAIQARKMWALGYTGRGRKALGVDTGVNTQHPSIAKRFLGDYAPLSESFYSYNNVTPVDIANSSHGTHTIATVLGRTTNNGDTIGIAYNAYYMVSDPIVSITSEIRRMSEILECFEWALNPDGNPETTNDIPDVITNSWGLTNTGNIEDCDLPEMLVFNAIEAAGVAVVFSAGNDGPGAGTIGIPANISRSTTNIFSVGAVDANNQTWPIASFSSRGPTNCPAEPGTPLHIKPEVVAPGVNVHSAQGLNAYGTLSGTSMAAPHVAGAVLLLKEAFPDITGTEILMALYETCTDLGEVGEDNTFGRGMINVWAAFQYLSQSYIPAEPPTGGDIKISATALFENIENDTIISTNINIENTGTADVNIEKFDVTINDQPFTKDTSITVTVGSVNSVNIKFSIAELPQNLYYDIIIYVKTAIGSDIDTINNRTTLSLAKSYFVSLPYTENFENADFDLRGAKVIIKNPDNAFTWRSDTVPRFNGGMQSATMKFRFYTNLLQRDIMELFPIEVGDASELKLGFKYAYAIKSIFAKDTLYVLVSTDGINYNDTVLMKTGESLATVKGWYYSRLFVPDTPDKWKYANVDLSQFIEAENIWIRFETVNGNGNDLFIDDIAVYEGDDPLPIDNETLSASAQQLILYPNPAKSIVNIMFSHGVNDCNIRVFDLSGREIPVYFDFTSSNEVQVKLPQLRNGIYLIEVVYDNEVKTLRFIVN